MPCINNLRNILEAESHRLRLGGGADNTRRSPTAAAGLPYAANRSWNKHLRNKFHFYVVPYHIENLPDIYPVGLLLAIPN